MFINVSMMTNIHWTMKNCIVKDRKGGESKYIIFLNESFKTNEGQWIKILDFFKFNLKDVISFKTPMYISNKNWFFMIWTFFQIQLQIPTNLLTLAFRQKDGLNSTTLFALLFCFTVSLARHTDELNSLHKFDAKL